MAIVGIIFHLICYAGVKEAEVVAKKKEGKTTNWKSIWCVVQKPSIYCSHHPHFIYDFS